MNYSESIKGHMSAWPRKLTSVMDIHRQRFSRINEKYKQRPVVNHHPPHPICPVILPQAFHPQHRQRARSKQPIQTHFPATPLTRRANSAHTRNQPLPSVSNQQYITLANLTRILHVLQSREKTNDNTDSATCASTSTITSSKQRVQQHLQETAARWWRPIRPSDSHPVPSSIHTSDTSTAFQQHSEENNQLQRNLPLLTIVSHSTQPMSISSTNLNKNFKHDESDVSTEILTTNVVTSLLLPVKTPGIEHNRHEPLIMQARSMRLHSYEHRYHTKHNNNMNFFQQQRLIRQT